MCNIPSKVDIFSMGGDSSFQVPKVNHLVEESHEPPCWAGGASEILFPLSPSTKMAHWKSRMCIFFEIGMFPEIASYRISENVNPPSDRHIRILTGVKTTECDIIPRDM